MLSFEQIRIGGSSATNWSSTRDVFFLTGPNFQGSSPCSLSVVWVATTTLRLSNFIRKMIHLRLQFIPFWNIHDNATSHKYVTPTSYLALSLIPLIVSRSNSYFHYFDPIMLMLIFYLSPIDAIIHTTTPGPSETICFSSYDGRDANTLYQYSTFILQTIP